MISLPIPTPSTNLLQVRFQLLSLVAGITLAVTGALAIASAEERSQPATRHRSGPAVLNVSAMPSVPATVYYIVTSAPSRVVPEEAVDMGQGSIPANVTLYFRVVDSPESEGQLLEELDWYVRNGIPHQMFDMR